MKIMKLFRIDEELNTILEFLADEQKCSQCQIITRGIIIQMKRSKDRSYRETKFNPVATTSINTNNKTTSKK